MSDQRNRPPGNEADADPRQTVADSTESELVDPDAVQLTDTRVSGEAVEPRLSTSPDAVELTEPSLETARISGDTAEAASLEEVAAEARAVEDEAKKTGTLLGGPTPVNDPEEGAAPTGTAPAGGAAGDVGDPNPPGSPIDSVPASNTPAGNAPDGDTAAHNSTTAKSVAGNFTTDRTPVAAADTQPPDLTVENSSPSDNQPASGNSPASQSSPAQGDEQTAADRDSAGSDTKKFAIIGVTAVVLIALLIWALVSVVSGIGDQSGSSPAGGMDAPGVHAQAQQADALNYS